MPTLRSSSVVCLLICTMLGTGTQAQAQELTLFEAFEAEPGEQGVTGPQQVFNMGNSQPAYTLRSVSRFGDRYEAVLISRSGEIAKVSWGAGESAPVQGMGGFTVVGMASGTVALQHPPGDACVNAEPNGVTCNGNLAQLTLAVAAPLPSNGVVGVPAPEQGNPFANAQIGGQAGFVDPAVNGQAGPQVFINPFSGQPETLPPVSQEELEQRAQRQSVRAARLRQFEQGGANPNTPVPPGMERVRTPFGDRDIPIRE